MTRTKNARVAGFAFLFYIAATLAGAALLHRATRGEGIATKLAGIAERASDVRIAVHLSMLMCLAALVLGVTLYALTREQDPDLALLALTCRVGEGVAGAAMPMTLGLLWLATATGADDPDTAAAHTLGRLLLIADAWKPLICGTLFAAGSLLFSGLFLRGRLVPTPLAWLGVVASILLLVGLPLQLAGFLRGPVTTLLWLPMLAFELPFAFWLLIKGVAGPTSLQSS